MARILADHTHHALAADDLAIAAYPLDRSAYFHALLLTINQQLYLFRAKDDATAREIVGSQFDSHFIAGQDTDVVHPHLAGDVPQHYMAVLELHPECRIRQGLHDLPLHLYRFF